MTEPVVDFNSLISDVTSELTLPAACRDDGVTQLLVALQRMVVTGWEINVKRNKRWILIL